MFRSKDLASWLTEAGIDVPYEFDGFDLSEAEQDTVVVLSMSGGPGETLERTFDVATVQIISRGEQNLPETTEDLAWSIDDALLGPTSTTIGGLYVSTISRVGSPPTLLNRDSARRSVFTCNYLFTVARTTF